MSGPTINDRLMECQPPWIDTYAAVLLAVLLTLCTIALVGMLVVAFWVMFTDWRDGR